jgi:L-aminopeptidase/D-esterase-like protein
VDVRGGGPGTRETDVIGPYAGSHEVSAVALCGGSAFGLAAADGVGRWLEDNGRGYETSAGLVPIVPAAVVYDLAEGDPSARPDADAGYAACEAATGGVPERGRVGAGTGAAVGKILGRERSTPAGIGYAAARSGRGEIVTALAVVNAFGDVIGADGMAIGRPRGGDGETVSTPDVIAAMEEPPDWGRLEERNTTLVCVMTDALLDKAACSRVARMASGGVARAVDPVFSDADGDVVFCLSSGEGPTDRFTPIAIGTIAATVTARAIRDSISPV